MDSDQLEKLLDFISEKVSLANRTGEIESLMDRWELNDIFRKISPNNDFYETDKNGKIVIIGDSQVNKNDIEGIIKSLNLDKNRFEYCLNYDDIVRYQFEKLRYNINYRLVLVGPMPHSTSGKGSSSSAIAEMEHNIGYPRIKRLSCGDKLKITKTSLKEALQEQIEQDYI